jgi:hypothetical protein
LDGEGDGGRAVSVVVQAQHVEGIRKPIGSPPRPPHNFFLLTLLIDGQVIGIKRVWGGVCIYILRCPGFYLPLDQALNF